MKRFLATLLAGWAVAASAARIEFDFSTDPVGKAPPGFASLVTGPGVPADWKVMDEMVPPLLAPLSPNAATHTTDRAILGVQSLNLTPGHLPVLLFTNEIFTDFTFATRFKIGGGVIEPMAGVVFRAQDQSNYYVVRASTEGNLLWYRVVNGRQYDTQGIGVRIPMAANVWRELRVQCKGNRIRCFLDGKLAIPPGRAGESTDELAINDTTFARGKVGFWTSTDSQCYFVDALVEYNPRVPYVQMVVNNIARNHPSVVVMQVYAGKEGTIPAIIGSIHDHDLGQLGTAVEEAVIEKSSVYYLKLKGTVEVILPVRDRNGDVAAALTLKMKAFPGETEATAVARATEIKKEIELQIATLPEITQ